MVYSFIYLFIFYSFIYLFIYSFIPSCNICYTITLLRVSHSLWNLNNWTNVVPSLQELLKEINIKDNTMAGIFFIYSNIRINYKLILIY